MEQLCLEPFDDQGITVFGFSVRFHMIEGLWYKMLRNSWCGGKQHMWDSDLSSLATLSKMPDGEGRSCEHEPGVSVTQRVHVLPALMTHVRL